MKAITTKVIPASETKPTRISASDQDGHRVTRSYDHSLESIDNHRAAALALCERMGWSGSLYGGYVKGGMVWVWQSPEYLFVIA